MKPVVASTPLRVPSGPGPLQRPSRGPAARRATARIGTLLLVGLLLPSCALFMSEPRVTLADVRVVQLGITGGTARVELEVENPNRFDLSVRTLAYRLEVAEGPAGEGGEERWLPLAEEEEVARDLTAPAGRTVRVEIPVEFQYRALGAAVRSFLADGEIRYRVRGTVRVDGPLGERRLPFASNGRMTP